MPDSVSEERRKLMKHYGAEVVLIHDAGNIGECIEECLNTALKMAEEDPRVFVPQQFENRPIRQYTDLRRLWRFWSRQTVRSTDSARGSEQEERSRNRRSAQGEESGDRDLGSRAGARGKFFPVVPSGRISRWESGTV